MEQKRHDPLEGSGPGFVDRFADGGNEAQLPQQADLTQAIVLLDQVGRALAQCCDTLYSLSGHLAAAVEMLDRECRP